MNKIFFDSWESIFRTGIITVLAYIILLVMLRASGKRTLTKMNAFDMVITIALGSTLASVTLDKNVALADGALTFFLLIFMQYFITWLSVRNKTFKHLVKAAPTLIAYDGHLMTDVMKKERITKEEVFEKLREKGHPSLKGVDAIILETAGSINVLVSKEYEDG